MNITLNQVKIFHAISRTGSITKAAEELHLSQPAVSIQLKNFQDQFEMPLTEIIGRKLYLTDYGKTVADAADRILTEVERIDFKSNSLSAKLHGKLRLSIVSTGKYVMPYFLTRFLKVHPSVDLNMDVTNKTKVIESLDNNEVDFSLVSILPENLRINNLELMENKLYLVGSGDNPYRKKNYSTDLLKELPLIYRERGSGTRQTMERFISSHKLMVRKTMELTSNEAVKQAVMAGLGYSIMPVIGIRNELNAGNLRVIPVKGLPLTSVWNLIWLKDKKFSPVAGAYLDFLTKEKEILIDENFGWVREE